MPYRQIVPELTPDTAFPGWARLEQDIVAAVNVGDDVKLSTVQAMTLLGEMARLKGLLDETARVMRRVQGGRDCWGSEQGYAACEFRGVQQLLDGAPKRSRRRWWRRA